MLTNSFRKYEEISNKASETALECGCGAQQGARPSGVPCGAYFRGSNQGWPMHTQDCPQLFQGLGTARQAGRQREALSSGKTQVTAADRHGNTGNTCIQTQTTRNDAQEAV